MQKYIIIILCIVNSFAFIKPENRQPREWNAQAYDNGNRLQTSAFFHFLKTNNINTHGINILDLGCGTGKISEELAKNATVHGIDASRNMIEWAKKYRPTASYEHLFAEDFNAKNIYDLVIVSSAFHWFDKDKKPLILKKIYTSLKNNGEFFANIETTSNQLSLNRIVLQEMLQEVPLLNTYLAEKNDPVNHIRPTDAELDTMITNAQFTLLTRTTQSFSINMTKDDLRRFQWPIISSRPGFNTIPSSLVTPLFEEFVDRCLKKLPKNEDGTYKYTYETTIVHAKKQMK